MIGSLLAATAWVAGCEGCGGDGSILVTVRVDPQASTDCVKVAAWSAPGQEQVTAPMPRQERDALSVALFPGGELGESVSIVARGYEGEGCQALHEETAPVNARFVPGRRESVELWLRGPQCLFLDAGSPCPGGVCRSDGTCVDAGTEFSCANGADDDGDSLLDCQDSDCLGVACGPAPTCQRMAVCQADGGCEGTPVVCNSPPGLCFQATGTCSLSTDQCQYQGDTSRACDDGDLCTGPDGCQLDGGCGGPPVTCDTPPGQCFSAPGACDPALGCRYPVASGPCDDGNPCTTGDSCLPDGGCLGTAPTCVSSDPCQAAFCRPDGGCGFSFRWGQACDAGLNCSPGGLCTGFPYDPSNFDPLDIPPASIAPSVLIDCAARYNTEGGTTSAQWCGRPPPPLVVIQQDGGPEAGLIATYSLTITSSGVLELVGSRPAMIAVFGNAQVDGVITARSLRGSTTGAGANPGAPYCAAAGNAAANSYAGGGGGGGGYGTAGGNGGTATGGGSAGAAGGAASGSVTLVPLRGGCPGGRGGQAHGSPGQGGAGGGAFQLSVARQLNVANSITASGAGGDGGQQDQTGGSGGGNGGGGGGSGGSVLLEGTRVAISSGARLTANGGGAGEGGSWDTGSTYTGYPGDNGSTLTDLSASGGDGPSCGGAGGNGGSRTGAVQNGGNSLNTSGCGGGGGGGAVGRIRINGLLQCAVDAGVLSPLPSYGGACP
jgi:hypothetical protein